MKRRRTNYRYVRPYKANTRLCGLALSLLALLVALGGIKGQEIKAVKSSLSFPVVDAYNLSNPTPTPSPKPSQTPKPSPAVKPSDPSLQTIVNLVRKHFPEEPAVALAIFKSESGLQNYRWSYNCFFDNDKAVSYKTNKSWVCPKGSEHLAWSIDCGFVMNNFPGLKECPKESFDTDWSLATARPKYDWRKSIGLTGWEAWTDYNNGKYKANLEWAKGALAEL